MSKLSARDYYYTFIAPEERGINYSQLHHTQQYEAGSSLRQQLGDSAVDRLQNEVAKFKPKFSNDILLERLMRELIASHGQPLRSRLERTFIAKRRSLFANAAAIPSVSNCDGYVVMFLVGLSDAAYQYSILFHDFSQVAKKVRDRDYGAPQRFVEIVKRVASAQDRWHSLGSYIQLTPDDQLDPSPEQGGKVAADIAACTDRFILAHEISHHILGHSEEAISPFGALSHGGQPVLADFESYPEAWRQELAADSAAIGLILGNGSKSATRMFVTAALGSLLTITMIGQLAADAHTGTDSHPAPSTRYLNAMLTLKSVSDPLLSQIHRDMSNFQSVLYRTMSRGIGSRQVDVS